MKNEYPHKDFGALITQLRIEAGFEQQSDLAALMKTTQQTVSRWEKGESCPSIEKLQTLASVLNVPLNELLILTGRTAFPEPVVTYVKTFPIWALSPDQLETFTADFLTALYPAARVNKVGSQGHTQEGTDVEVTFPDGTNHSFQCKRHNVFGPDKVAKAVHAHTRHATKKFILLTRTASPQARDEIKRHADWDIWDVEDVSRQIRTLSKDAQRRLVDTFFRGQRLALLGETEPGPWQTTEEFFAAFMSGRRAFSHSWDLVGRTKEVKTVLESLSNPDLQTAFLIGAGGSGKSRILKKAVETCVQDHPDVLVRFLSPTEEVTNKSLEDLGDRKKILVVDDAHDRSDLQLLFQHTAISTNTTLLLSFRPYGLDYIKAQVGNFALSDEQISEIKLEPLTLKEAKQLATQVLEAFDGPVWAAEDIARLTLDCPLFTVIGAQVVAKEKIHPELAKNEDAFRSTLLGKFQDIIAGDIGNKNDSASIKKLLKVLALLQPFHPEDESISKTVESVEGLTVPESNRLIRLLTDAGVLFRRGSAYRLSPDLLADHIIEEVCIGQEGRSTGYAEQVFDVASNTHVEHLLLNLGKLDWRRANGDPSNSQLLDGVWKKLQPSRDYSDPHIAAVMAVAYYQPKRALDFAENLIHEQKYLEDLPNLIKGAAYSYEHLPHACECLWELGKSDDRALHQYPGHATRILSELCEIDPNKSIEYNEVVVDFGLHLLEMDDSWKHKYSPFDVLKSILQTEGHTTDYDGRRISYGPFLVSSSCLSPLRVKVIDATLKLLSHSNTKIAVMAANFLHEGLRYPSGPLVNMQTLTEAREAWTEEFIETLEKIERATQTHTLDPLVLIALARSVFWHAYYNEGKTTPIANRLIDLLPNSLEFRTFLELTNGYGRPGKNISYEQITQAQNQRLDTLKNDLLSTYPDGENLRSFLDKKLSYIQKNYVHDYIYASAHELYRWLIRSSISLASATVKQALARTDSKTDQFAGMALAQLLSDDHMYGLSVAHQFLETDSPNLLAAVGSAYSAFVPNEKEYDEEDIIILRKILASTDPVIASSAVWAMRIVQQVAESNPRLVIDLLKCVDLSISNRVADDVFMIFREEELIRSLTEEDIKYFLEKLIPLPELNGFWVDAFLSKLSEHHAQFTADFFMARVEYAAETEKALPYRPCNFGPYVTEPLRFRESTEFGLLLRQVYQWMKSKAENNYFQHRASELFDAMFSPFDRELISFIQDWIDESTPSDMRIITQILKKVHPNFVFEHQGFVVRFLDRAKQDGKQILNDALDALYRSATTGSKSGPTGEPFAEDLVMKEEAEKALKEIPRFSPAYRLYELIKSNVERSIQWSLKRGEAFED
jgi:transcriptional regulator with XRE-family HTH domain